MDQPHIRKIDIDREMQQSYLDYAMSVIVSRALPDARDGLKPVQRRILYAMHDLGLSPSSQYKKSARIVGEVLGKYHPHGDMAVYDAMARLAQDFTMRCMLVDGQGNFGSVDGDPPAAMRYTEARLTAASIEMLKNIEKNTVNFIVNFDGTLKEPVVLPSQLPNLLVNGATGIAVGMATNIPPHNLGEVVDACVHVLEQWEKLDDLSVEDLMHFIKGPDFPTGGIILQDPATEGLAMVYGSGRGKVIVQARAHVEEMERSKNRIIVTELPYMVNKASLIERIADLVREGNLEGVVDLRDESDRHGLRVVIELSKMADPENILRKLYKHTPMQTTFGIILLALVGGEPRLLSLKQALKVFLDHRLEVIKRRSEFDLERAKQRAHILEGLRIALKNLDEIISLIRNSPDADEAKLRLIKRYKLSDLQAQAILDMPLRRLAALERKKIEEEYKELMALISELEGLLKSPKRIRETCAAELLEARQMFAEKRKTQIIGLKEGKSISKMLTITDATPSQNVLIGINESGIIARTAQESASWMGGKDAPLWLVRTDTHQTLYLVSITGKAAAIPVHAIPEATSVSEGVPLYKVSPLNEDDPLGAIFCLPSKSQMEEKFVTTITRSGMVKKTSILELPGPSASTFVLCKVNDGDSVGWSMITDGTHEFLLGTSKGMCIRFKEEDVRPMGLVATGVNGIKLGVGDEVVSANVLQGLNPVLMISTDGKGKKCPVVDFPIQGRYGQGVIGWKLKPGIHLAGLWVSSRNDPLVIHFLKSASKIKKPDDFSAGGRAAQGKEVIEVKPGDQVIGITGIDNALNGNSRGDGGKSPGGSKQRKNGKSAPKQTGKETTKPSAKPSNVSQAEGRIRLKKTASKTVSRKTKTASASIKRSTTKVKPTGRTNPEKTTSLVKENPAKPPTKLQTPKTKEPLVEKSGKKTRKNVPGQLPLDHLE